MDKRKAVKLTLIVLAAGAAAAAASGLLPEGTAAALQVLAGLLGAV